MSDCNACIWSGGGDDPPSVFSETTPRARKPHCCCECGETISVGTRYERATGIWDGKFHTFKTCSACVEIRRAFCCEGWTYGTLWEDASESFFESMNITCLDKLTTAAAKEKLLAEWRRYKGIEATEAAIEALERDDG